VDIYSYKFLHAKPDPDIPNMKRFMDMTYHSIMFSCFPMTNAVDLMHHSIKEKIDREQHRR